ncbi:MAG: F0F1 ATP synthase subunit epsilon [Hyphomicrobiaceae bacterium]
MATFKFELVSPERILMSEDVEQVVVPGGDGDFAVLAGHAPVISTIRPGILDVTLQSGRKQLLVKSGFAEVDPERLTVLAEWAHDLSELSADRINKELAAAEESLAAAHDDSSRLSAFTLVEVLKGLQSARAH